MPLGWKYDEAATKAARKAKIFLDRRSRMDTNGLPHLKGRDVGVLRRACYERAQGRCEQIKREEIGEPTIPPNSPYAGCIARVEKVCEAFAAWEGFKHGEMHHVPDGYERVDTLDHVVWSCWECHRRSHVQVQLGTIPL